MKHMKKLFKCQETINYTTKKLLDYLHHQKHYKINEIDLLRQKKCSSCSTN